ncbi:hypothetical protein EDB89DRAFT_1110111 [Lactarius sanguifluus]|nr:hypothetical protein EDB89DRAFT_1110111 [Lactarius sanguifluus]
MAERPLYTLSTSRARQFKWLAEDSPPRPLSQHTASRRRYAQGSSKIKARTWPCRPRDPERGWFFGSSRSCRALRPQESDRMGQRVRKTYRNYKSTLPSRLIPSSSNLPVLILPNPSEDVLNYVNRVGPSPKTDIDPRFKSRQGIITRACDIYIGGFVLNPGPGRHSTECMQRVETGVGTLAPAASSGQEGQIAEVGEKVHFY